MLILDKGEFKARNISRDKASYFIMTYRSIHWNNIKFLNLWALNSMALRHRGQKLTQLKREIRQIYNDDKTF